MTQELRIRHRNRRLEAVESIDARDECLFQVPINVSKFFSNGFHVTNIVEIWWQGE